MLSDKLADKEDAVQKEEKKTVADLPEIWQFQPSGTNHNNKDVKRNEGRYRMTVNLRKTRKTWKLWQSRGKYSRLKSADIWAAC